MTETENHFVWDLAFLGSGVLLMGLGIALISAARNDSVARGMNP